MEVGSLSHAKFAAHNGLTRCSAVGFGCRFVSVLGGRFATGNPTAAAWSASTKRRANADELSGAR